MEKSTSKFPTRLLGHLLAQLPFIAMLGCAFFGVAYTSVSRHAMSVYWTMLVPAFGLISIMIAWRGTHGGANWRAALVQALHWGMVLLAMDLALVADMEKAMSAEASALVLLVILALGTATAGLHLRAWPIVIVGAVLGMGVPIFAWLEERTLLFALAILAVAAVAAMVFEARRRSIAATRRKDDVASSEHAPRAHEFGSLE